MLTIYSDVHHLHHGHSELHHGQMRPCFETPERADMILQQVRAVGLGAVRPPKDFGLAPVERVHDADYVAFLAEAWAEWSAQGNRHDALASTWPVRGLRNDRPPLQIDGKLGYYSFDAGAPIVAGTWEAVRQSANVALTGAEILSQGAASVFALCRPPGHHAGSRFMGGFCYLNNAAIAAQALRDAGAARVAILDVDYHHGNGTQQIFYERADVLFVSLHADPLIEYPYFLGHADEIGARAGTGFNLNYPLPAGCGGAAYAAALTDACARIKAYGPDAVVVSLGLDTFKDDPLGVFENNSADFEVMGRIIAGLAAPTLFVQEGGYAVGDIGVNAVNVLSAFEDAS